MEDIDAHVYIIESLPAGDIKTGSNLNDELRQFAFDEIHSDIHSYYLADTKAEFQKSISKILYSVKEASYLPIIQIECHGSESGLHLSDGNRISWTELYDMIRPINIASNNKLVLHLSMCHGDAIIKAISPDKRAPYKICIGSIGISKPDQLQETWIEIIKRYFTGNRNDIDEFLNLLSRQNFTIYNQDIAFDIHFDLANKGPELFNALNLEYLSNLFNDGALLCLNVEGFHKWVAKQQKRIYDTYKPYFCFEDIEQTSI